MPNNPRSPQIRRRRGLLALGAGAAACTLLVTGCSGSGGTGSPSGHASTLVAYTGQSGDYQINFNPYSPSSIGGVGTIYEPLFFYNKAKASKPVPLLATKQSWNKSGTRLAVTLRSGVKWSDGKAFTADDVVFTFNLLKRNPSINAIGFKGSVRKVDATHVVFSFAEPAFVKGPDILSSVIVPKHLWASINPTKDVVAKPVGTGAYLLKSFKPQAFTFAANPHYWGGAPKVQQIRWMALSGNQAGADGIAGGTIDWNTGPIPNVQKTHQQFPNYDAFTQWQSQMVLAACSSAAQGCTGPQTDPAVRHALYYAIDRTQLNKLAFMGTAGKISPSFALTPSQDKYVSDAVDEKLAPSTAKGDKAAQILRADGWTKGADGIYQKNGRRLSLTIQVVTGWTDYITAINTITSQAKAAGIEIRAEQSSWNEWTDKKVNGKFQLVIDSLYQGPTSDPYYLYNYFFDSSSGAKVGKPAGNNYVRYANPKVDAAINSLSRMPLGDSPARTREFATIQKAIVADMPYIPVLTGGTTSEWNTAKFTGWPSEQNLYAFPAVWSRLDSAQVFKHLQPKNG
ncbi:MAG TPA: ABC transporter substrate-binding protein [Flexivirga sp.]|uniref:ABC transporter substrate-binding protein n=1 Tax=Flexivirga sp. TaxID=1962927 RepID=UPI002D06E831|nr:ABC transporter substrate-binding protein [Flexivirga sp.]HWC23580.1 ABC transporter substrate-binding protein [Flexivirga sp.]